MRTLERLLTSGLLAIGLSCGTALPQEPQKRDSAKQHVEDYTTGAPPQFFHVPDIEVFIPETGITGFNRVNEYIRWKHRDALELILEAAQDHDVITIGEEHFNLSLYRFIAEEVIPALDERGFTFLALEFPRYNQFLPDDYLSPHRPTDIGDVGDEMWESARSHGWNIYFIDSRNGENQELENLHHWDKASVANLADLLLERGDLRDKGLILYGDGHVAQGNRWTRPQDRVLGYYLNELFPERHFSIYTFSTDTSDTDPMYSGRYIDLVGIPTERAFFTRQSPIQDVVFNVEDSERFNLYGDYDAMMTLYDPIPTLIWRRLSVSELEDDF